MSCAGCGGAFFRQLNTVTVSAANTDVKVVPLSAPLIAWSWWQVGKRLVFEVPAAGVLYAETTFGVRLRDNTALANFVLASLNISAGTEIESFRIVCDVSAINNSEVTLKCWVDYGFPVGLGANPFSEVTINTNFHPLEVQVYFQQAESVESSVTFQNVQFTGMPKTATLIC